MYVPGYIPSRRILKEGGYEGGGAMVYYDHPTRFAPAVEDMIIGAVHELMPAEFVFDEKKVAVPAGQIARGFTGRNADEGRIENRTGGVGAVD